MSLRGDGLHGVRLVRNRIIRFHLRMGLFLALGLAADDEDQIAIGDDNGTGAHGRQRDNCLPRSVDVAFNSVK